MRATRAENDGTEGGKGDISKHSRKWYDLRNILNKPDKTKENKTELRSRPEEAFAPGVSIAFQSRCAVESGQAQEAVFLFSYLS